MKKDKKQAAVSLPDFLQYRRAADTAPQPRPQYGTIVIATIAGAFVIFAYVFCVGEGHFGPWHTRSWGYSLLADGFMQGQTYLPVDPAPGLLALPDPYDPLQNRIYPCQDTSLFNGHFYYYFGPLPALLLVLVKMCLDEPATVIGDEYLVFAFAIGLLTATALSILRWRRTFFPQARAWTVAPAIIAVSMSLPLTWLVANPAMLEATVAGGQFLLLLGLFFAMSALQGQNPSWPKMCAAGMAWALACGCRLSLAAAIGAIALLTLLELRGRGQNRRAFNQWGKSAAALIFPLAAAAIGLLIYNHVRFGSWTETGWNYELAYMNHHALAGKGIIVSPRYIPANLYRYLIELPKLSRHFPFLILQKGAHGLVRLFPPPPEYPFVLEPTAGIIWSAPFCLLALGLLAPGRSTTTLTSLPLPQATPDLFRWLTRCLLVACVLAMAPVLIMIVSVERYLADGALALMLLAVLGAWRLLDYTRGKPSLHWPVVGAIVFLGATTAVFGILLLFAPQ